MRFISRQRVNTFLTDVYFPQTECYNLDGDPGRPWSQLYNKFSHFLVFRYFYYLMCFAVSSEQFSSHRLSLTAAFQFLTLKTVWIQKVSFTLTGGY